LTLFGKKKTDQTAAEAFRRDQRKANRFFEHAAAVAQSRNHEYAIECYINGLKHEPDKLAAHQALREVALQRKVAGGKPAGLTEKFKKGGKDPIDKLLHVEALWAKDPLNVSHMVDVMTRAGEAAQALGDLDLAPVIAWVGKIAVEANQTAKTPNKNVYVKVRDWFVQIKAFASAVHACQLALAMDPNNASLKKDLKNLEAERTMQEGGYEDAAGQEGGFHGQVKDIEKQQQLERDHTSAKTSSAIDEDIERRRIEYEEDPHDMDRLGKLVSALVRKETDDAEKEAIKLLALAMEQTGQYRYKMRIGDIRMRQINRRLRVLQAQVKAHPDDTPLRNKYQDMVAKKLKFELEEYTQRIKNYPTDLGLRYELGKRLYAFKKYDEAISAFQQAKVDPKHRVVSLEFLGRCYIARGWVEEAIDTLGQGIEAYPSSDDRLAMDMRYQLMLALKQLATKDKSVDHARESQKIASQVLQTDINYRDIRRQMEDIRKLVDQLSKGE